MSANTMATVPPNPAIQTVAGPVDTTQKSGSVFSRVSARAQIPGTLDSIDWGQNVYVPKLKPVGGYLTHFDVTLIASGGVGSTTAAVATPDGIWAVLGNLLLQDIESNPAVSVDGYGLKCIQAFGGQSGALGFGNNPDTRKDTSAMNTGGNFEFTVQIPLEFGVNGYCSWPLQNSSAMPPLTFGINNLSAVYATEPSPTLPTLQIKVDEPYWIQPQDTALGPMDVGSSHQWKQSAITQLVPSAQYVDNLEWPTVGTWEDTLIAVLRDSTGARVAAWPQYDLQLWVDNVPKFNETFLQRAEKIYEEFGIDLTSVEWTGVMVWSFRKSVQNFVSALDTLDVLLQTTPATSITIRGTFGAIANAPGRITTYTGQLFPTTSEPPYGAEA